MSKYFHVLYVWVLLGAVGCRWVLSGAFGCFWMFLDAFGCFWVLLGAFGCYLELFAYIPLQYKLVRTYRCYLMSYTSVDKFTILIK